MTNLRRLTAVLILLMVCAVFSGAAGWQEEFDDICSKTQMADTLATEELEDLCRRCDALLPVIQASADRKKKVYVFRLKKCRALFEFTIQTRQPQ